jgi:hypothetical protein
MGHWSYMRHELLSMEVLHLGPRDRHWFSTSPEAQDMMDGFVIRNGWIRAAGGLIAYDRVP